MNTVSVVIPIYNEEKAIADDLDVIIRTMDAWGGRYEVIVVDDGSTDRSAEIVSQYPTVRLIRHPYNRGTGAARNTGLLAAQGDVVVMTDGDGTYPNQDIPRLLEFIDQYDMVIGARKQERGTLPWLRAPAKFFIRKLASYLVNVPIPDLNSGFRAFRRESALRWLHILPSTHSWVSTITIAFLSDGYFVKWIPIDYYARKGRSSFRPIRDTYNYISLVLRSVVYFNPLKVFLPVSAALFTIGGVKMIYDIFKYHFHFAPSTVILVATATQIFVMGLLADLIARASRLGRGWPS
ncbi:MAG: glycosyltransferase family 2 protein [Chloroflexi bacterium]|nr:glycosyltransferase family 2 protein [Chloroflexota bacterium]